MAYVDGFLIAVPRRKMKAYVKMARQGRKMWMKLGALHPLQVARAPRSRQRQDHAGDEGA